MTAGRVALFLLFLREFNRKSNILSKGLSQEYIYQKLEEICKTLQVIKVKLADANKERVHLLKNLSTQRLCSRQLAFLY